MKKYLVLLHLLFCLQLKAQLPTFDNPYVPKIYSQVKLIDSLLDENYLDIQLQLDSAEIFGEIWENKIETLNNFQISGTKLNITFYLQNNELIFSLIIFCTFCNFCCF